MAQTSVPFQERFQFGGMRLTSVPDGLPPGKYAALQNVRGNPGGTSIVTRPGSAQQFTCNNNPITDICSYANLSTDDAPRFLVRDSAGGIFLDNNNATPLTTLTGNVGFGASMIPFRPAESPGPYMYVAGIGQYQKFSAPSGSNAVVQANVGIAEPQNQVDATVANFDYIDFTGVASSWSNNGTGGALSDGNRSSETTGAAVGDGGASVNNTGVGRYSVAVNNSYAVGEVVNFNSNQFIIVVDGVLPAVVSGNNALTLQAIKYRSGNNGLCTIVPSPLPLGAVAPGLDQIASLQRGSLVKIASGNSNETCFVLDAFRGPDGSVAFETSTTNTWAANATISGVSAISVFTPALNNTASQFSGINVTSKLIQSNITSGIATFTQNLTNNPFNQPIYNVGPPFPTIYPQEDSYIHLSINVSDPSQVNEIKLLFCLDSNATFQGNVLFYSIRPSDLAGFLTNNNTTQQAILGAATQQLISDLASTLPANGSIPELQAPGQATGGNNQWSEIWFQISSLTRLGGDQTRTLSNCSAVQVLVNANNNLTFQMGGLWVGGARGADVGNDGASYQYRCVPVSSATGVRGNPTPPMRYGVRPRRQGVFVLPPTYSENQVDTWDVERYGGSVTSWRYIGSMANNTFFTDVYSDAAATAGDLMETDNFQPWPSIDVPFRVTSSTATLSATGQFLTISGFSNWPSTIDRWLPGTIFATGSQGSNEPENQIAYTLRSRPVKLSSTSYQFEMEECMGAATPDVVWVLEPKVAAQVLPYLWGPDAAGTIFGVGDPLRPGFVSFTKSNGPDAAPDSYNLELCDPSETLVGGVVIGGLSLASSTKRWWALYPAFDTTSRYTATELPVGRGNAAPYAITTDGQRIFFWSKDGIWMASSGGGGESLTDEDLYPLFPHDGIVGQNIIRNAATFYAPDYGRAATFRLAFSNSMLYALYQDTTGTYRMLVCDLRTKAWSSDSYATAVSGIFAVPQQEGTLTTSHNTYPLLMMGLNNGHVDKQQALTNDNFVSNNSNGTGITAIVQTREFDGGQQEVNGLWRDVYVDAFAPNGYNATPVSLNANASNTTTIAANNTRQLQQVQVNNGTIERFMGVQIQWTDQF